MYGCTEMSVFTVSFNFRTFKAKPGPSVQLQDVLRDACAYFKIDSGDFGLSYNGKPLELSLPVRLANLPNNIKLELVKAPKAARPLEDQQVSIRVQVADAQCQGTFRLSTPIREVLLYCETQTGTPILGRKEETMLQQGDKMVRTTVSFRPIVQSFSKLVTDTEFDKPLFTLAEKDSVLRVKFEKVVESSDVSESVHSQPVVEASDDAAPQPVAPNIYNDAASVSAPVTLADSSNVPDARVYLPDQVSHKSSDDSYYDMTLDQARKYQKMLSARAAEQPMLTRRLRQMQEKPKPSIETYTIRVKFPDQSNLQMNVNSNSTVQDFVSVLKNNYLDDIHDFHLFIPHPYALLNTQENLAKAIHQVFVEQRQLLVFEPKAALSNRRYLKREVLESAKALTEMDEVKLDSVRNELPEKPNDDQAREKKEKRLAKLLGLNRK